MINISMTMKLIKYLIFLIAFYCFTGELIAQYDYPGETPSEQENKRRRRSDDSKIFFGGNLGLMFGSNYGYFELSPLVGYKVTPRFWVGGGPKYMYYREGSYRTNIYGIKNFASFAVLDKINEVTNLGIGSLFLYIENEVLSMEPIEYDNKLGYYVISPRGWYDILLGGVGIRVPITQNAGLSIIALWGFTDAAEYLYSNPEIRISFDF